MQIFLVKQESIKGLVKVYSHQYSDEKGYTNKKQKKIKSILGLKCLSTGSKSKIKVYDVVSSPIQKYLKKGLILETIYHFNATNL